MTSRWVPICLLAAAGSALARGEDLRGRPASPGTRPDACLLRFETGKIPKTAWTALASCLAGSKSARWPDGDLQCALDCPRLVTYLFRHAGPQDERRFWESFDAIPAGPPGSEKRRPFGYESAEIRKSHLLDGVFDGRLWRAAAALPPPPGSPPLAQTLAQAKALYEQLPKPHYDQPDIATRAYSWGGGEAAFADLVMSFARGRIGPDRALDEVARFTWGNWCGTGSEEYGSQRPRLVALALLEKGEARRAAAAVLATAAREFDQPPEWEVRTLEAAGIDWEAAHAGALLEGIDSAARQLAARGSERGARLLLEAARAPHPSRPGARIDDSPAVLYALGALVTPAVASCLGSAPLEVPRPLATLIRTFGPWSPGIHRVAAPVPPEVQLAVLERLGEKVQPNQPRDEASETASLLVDLCRPESAPAFQAMTRSPFEALRFMGARALRTLGLPAPTVLRSVPVRIQIVVDGRPAPAAALQYRYEAADQGGSSRGLQLATGGVAELERDAFVDPRRPLTYLSLHTGPTAAEQPWYWIGMDRPADLEAPVTVKVDTARLEIVNRSGAKRRVQVLASRGPREWNHAVTGAVELQDALVLPTLQLGRYRVKVLREPESVQEIQVGAAGATVEVD